MITVQCSNAGGHAARQSEAIFDGGCELVQNAPAVADQDAAVSVPFAAAGALRDVARHDIDVANRNGVPRSRDEGFAAWR
jgi:NAD(P)H-dependent flavin oxidoreductase YrpB (nitropropane dioxygenase family)